MAKAKLEIRIWNNDGELPEDLPEAFAPHVAHVQTLVEQDYICGEICDEKFRGWWEIIS